jgi:DNA-binding transcriptional LysR family regulator
MDYRDNVFLTVAENLSFTSAAEELFISQPAVTKHIKELENKLKIQLFIRKGNKIYLTKAGKLTYHYLKEIKQQYNELNFKLARINDTYKGILKIGASSTISQYIIPKVIVAFHKHYPKIELYLFNGNSLEIEQKLLENEIDFALVENESSQTNIKYINFLDDEIVAVSGINSVYAKKKTLTIADLQQIPIILREKGSGTLEVIQKNLSKHNVNIDKLNILIHLGSTESIKNSLQEFDGIALISEKSIEKELQIKTINKIQIKNLSIIRKYRIALHYGPISSTAELFQNFLINYNF